MGDSSVEQHTCRNCGNVFVESFCNRCGQKEAHRITIGHVMHDLVHVFLHADKGILPFIPRLVLSPGIIANEFIQGKRKIFNPFQYLIISVGVVLFLLAQSNFYESLERYNREQTTGLPGYFNKALGGFNYFVKKYANLITFLTLPILALFSKLVFKARGHNYAEHFTIQVFVMSQVNTINILFLLGFVIFGASGLGTAWLPMALSITCLSITYKQLYNLKWYNALFNGVMVYGGAYVVQVLLMGVGLVAYIIALSRKG